jgi:hypothetical protein
MAYYSELQTLDFALGAYLNGIFSNISLHGPKEFQEFLQRPANKKIFRHRADDTATFIRDFINHEAGKQTPGTPTDTEIRNFLNLPCVNYFRRPGLVVSDELIINHMGKSVTFTDDLGTAFSLDCVPLTLTYGLRFVAWDDLTLDKMMLAYVNHVLKTKESKNRFECTYRVGSQDIVMPNIIKGVKQTIFDDASPQGIGRVVAAETNIEVEALVAFGGSVNWVEPVELIGTLGKLIP